MLAEGQPLSLEQVEQVVRNMADVVEARDEKLNALGEAPPTQAQASAAKAETASTTAETAADVAEGAVPRADTAATAAESAAVAAAKAAVVKPLISGKLRAEIGEVTDTRDVEAVAKAAAAAAVASIDLATPIQAAVYGAARFGLGLQRRSRQRSSKTCRNRKGLSSR